MRARKRGTPPQLHKRLQTGHGASERRQQRIRECVCLSVRVGVYVCLNAYHRKFTNACKSAMVLLGAASSLSSSLSSCSRSSCDSSAESSGGGESCEISSSGGSSSVVDDESAPRRLPLALPSRVPVVMVSMKHSKVTRTRVCMCVCMFASRAWAVSKLHYSGCGGCTTEAAAGSRAYCYGMRMVNMVIMSGFGPRVVCTRTFL